jgi:hypothetical protein
VPESELALLSPDDPVEDVPATGTVVTGRTRLELGRSRKGWARGYQLPDAARPVL